MPAKISKMFEGDRKYFAIVFFVLLLILISGILTPVYIRYTENDWPQKLTEKIGDIESDVNSILKQKEDNLLGISAGLRQKLRTTLNPGNSSYGALVRLVNDDAYDSYSVEVLAPNGKMIAWNRSIAIEQDNIFPLSFPVGETHFYSSDLIMTFGKDIFHFTYAGQSAFREFPAQFAPVAIRRRRLVRPE